MFGLEQQALWDLWNSTLTTASWKAAPSLEQNTEYLRLKPPFLGVTGKINRILRVWFRYFEPE